MNRPRGCLCTVSLDQGCSTWDSRTWMENRLCLYSYSLLTETQPFLVLIRMQSTNYSCETEYLCLCYQETPQMFSWLMYTHHCCETRTQHWVSLFNAFTKRHKCYYITDLILKDYLGNYISVYSFPFAISYLLLYMFKTLSEKGFVGVTRLPKRPMQLQRPRMAALDLLAAQNSYSSLTQVCATLLASKFPFSCPPASFSFCLFFRVCGIPPLQATKKKKKRNSLLPLSFPICPVKGMQ